MGTVEMTVLVSSVDSSHRIGVLETGTVLPFFSARE
jgi:hypothetical protein